MFKNTGRIIFFIIASPIFFIGVPHSSYSQAIELDTFYTDSFCVAAPLPLPSDTIDLQEERTACIEALKASALENAYMAWKDSIAQIIAQHINQQKCLVEPFEEQFTVTHPTTEHHYTLYYYDLAGYLIQTIPPAGVRPLIPDDFPEGKWNGEDPGHDTKHISRYQYNSTGQIINQFTPDAGSTTFLYDRVQRLRFSQNAEQVAENDIAYTKYDNQSRVIEVGELNSHSPTAEEIADPDFPDGISPTVNDPVYTTYDFIDAPGTIPSENTRGRIASLKNIYTAAFYDYDPHGNVREYTQIIPYLVDDTISMEYDYDLISGNVNEFRYEPDINEKDVMTQRYLYDADNRLMSAYSSDDGFVFDEDARYFYYLHGPLARVELGEDKVQGLDSYYTLQGWIKGVNMIGLHGPLDDPMELPGLEPGKDGFVTGLSNMNRYISFDAMSYALSYHDIDYKPVGGLSLLSNYVSQSLDDFDDEILGPSGHKGFFGGNIAVMMTDNNIGPMAMGYRYDALQRIKYAINFSAGNDDWDSSDHDYFIPEILYDPNGNIKEQEIHHQSDTDPLVYHYKNDQPNILDYVEGGGNVTNLEPQSAGNYEYDEIGNLIEDESEDADMTWDVYGKLRTVHTDDGTFEYEYDVLGNRISKFNFPFRDIYVRDASGNLIAVYDHVSEFTFLNQKLKEFHLYGSRRLGILHDGRIVASNNEEEEAAPLSSFRGQKRFELSNHLGNVLTSISDYKLGIDNSPSGSLDYYQSDVRSTAGYYPFGLEIDAFTDNSDEYRFGFNGKEKDLSLSSATHYDYGFRIYNPALGRFLSVDPLTKSYPWYTPYQFAGNTPIEAIDLDGLEEFHTQKGNITPYTRMESDQNFLSKTSAWIYNAFVGEPYNLSSFAINEVNQLITDPKGFKKDVENFVQDVKTSFTQPITLNSIKESLTNPDNYEAAPLMLLGGGFFKPKANIAFKPIPAPSLFSASVIDEAVGLVMKDPNKLGHIFTSDHNLGSLVKTLGGQENTIRAALNSANGKLPSSGVFNEISISVEGHNILVSGNVINNVPRIGTMYIPNKS